MSAAPGRPCSAPIPVELAGPAGAGKSTISQLLLSRYEDIGRMPLLRKRPHAHILARHVVAVLFTLIRRRALGRHTSVEQLRTMAYLQAMPEILAERWHEGRPIVLFDQGPIFSLTRPPLLDESLSDWWEAMFEEWSRLLRLVVWLDAPDLVLFERINQRAKEHRVRGRPKQDVLAFLANSRAVYSRTLSRLEGSAGRAAILRVDTSLVDADEAVALIRSRVDGIVRSTSDSTGDVGRPALATPPS